MNSTTPRRRTTCRSAVSNSIADQGLCKSKFQPSSLRLSLHRPFYVRSGRISRRPVFSSRGSLFTWVSIVVYVILSIHAPAESTEISVQHSSYSRRQKYFWHLPVKEKENFIFTIHLQFVLSIGYSLKRCKRGSCKILFKHRVTIY